MVGPDLEVIHSQSSEPTWVLSPNTIKIRSVFQHLIKGAKSIWSSKSGFSYVPIGQGPINEKLTTVLKGHLVVYVGQKDNDYHRVLVSIIYFNHPLSDELLREAEEEYGFSHQGVQEGLDLYRGWNRWKENGMEAPPPLKKAEPWLVLVLL
ncbi:hypothetical protein GOBAR_DD15989 [Gossypium barbadense]|nr:hypothetical protein GOBAR_DD15989 [Gossypium barbadense]